VLESVRKYMKHPEKLNAIEERALTMSGLRPPAEVVHEVHEKLLSHGLMRGPGNPIGYGA
jgi:hypothetical protein